MISVDNKKFLSYNTIRFMAERYSYKKAELRKLESADLYKAGIDAQANQSAAMFRTTLSASGGAVLGAGFGALLSHPVIGGLIGLGCSSLEATNLAINHLRVKRVNKILAEKELFSFEEIKAMGANYPTEVAKK